MKKERLLFMALGGLLVLAGMIVDKFVFSPVQAEVASQEPDDIREDCNIPIPYQ